MINLGCMMSPLLTHPAYIVSLVSNDVSSHYVNTDIYIEMVGVGEY